MTGQFNASQAILIFFKLSLFFLYPCAAKKWNGYWVLLQQRDDTIGVKVFIVSLIRIPSPLLHQKLNEPFGV